MKPKVQILYDKIRSTGAHKAILFSTAAFQDGAIEYALRHKIALIRMLSDRFEKVTNKLTKNGAFVYWRAQLPAIIGECLLHPRQVNYVKPGKIGTLVNYLSASN